MKILCAALALLIVLIVTSRSGNPTRKEAPQGLVPGPDVVVGEMSGLQQFGSVSGQVGLALAPTSCNAGDMELNFFVMPNTDHPVIAQNLYRMSGGPANNDRFEQIAQSWVKHTFGANQDDACSYGCIPAPDQTTLGPGCSDPYDASTGAAQDLLGSRAWVNPFTGSFPTNANQHTGHTHNGTAHRLVAAATDLSPASNPGATYYAEVQYITPHEYDWCQAHPGECNMYNNASYRRFNVAGTTNFTFSAVGQTVRARPAIEAWPGAVITPIHPAPEVDGQAFVASKVTGPVNGVWHYEYAIYNQNLDRAIQSFALPLGCGATATNLGFRAPQNPPGFANDGTLNSSGYSNAAWTTAQSATSLSWSTETFAQNPNANAIRWGTLYNFRFDSNRAPQVVNATFGFFKTGAPLMVSLPGPAIDACNALQVVSAVSRKTHGSAGDFDISLPTSGEPGVEPRDVGGLHTIVVNFTNAPVSGQAAISSGTGTVSGAPAFSENAMVVQLSGVADRQKLSVTLSDVTDSFGQVMPAAVISVNLLSGDVNGNRTVNATDIGQVKALSGAPLDATNFRVDLNANGAVTASDVAQVKAAAGNTVP